MRSSNRLLSLLLLLTVLAVAQASAGVATLRAPNVQAHPHSSASAVVEITVEPGFHIQSNHPTEPFLIPTSLTIEPANGIQVTQVDWPQAKQQKFSFSPTPLAVFAGTVKVPLTLHTAAAGTYRLHGTFRYQACNDQLCRPPVTTLFLLDVTVR